MSDTPDITQTELPDSRFKLPTPFSNMYNATAYPAWTPIDTRSETSKVFRFSFYSTIGAYTWLYFWKRTTFKLELPLTFIGFTTVAVATKSMVANLREKNDGWNLFWGVGLGNLAVLTAGFKHMPLRHKFMTGISGAAVSGLLNQWLWAQSTSSAGRDVRHFSKNDEVPKQGFWDVVQRKPLSQVVEEVGVGRGILKP
ncbi:hypothetical protein CLIB1444_01S09846 [[Candida] jaroonii]|uniref:Uncharacterized protein n=1 Tax=[Candida] jaroonii TaxID=467808 RepID=A0ACA9Y0W2_9ASCO|nr:hypothetical protein CLIB1444_01S09846 [[Candida] jaroonii]